MPNEIQSPQPAPTRKHTPGPWSASMWTDDIAGAVGWSISAGDPSYLVPKSTFEGDEEEAEANARLIAAAPGLLAAAEMGHADSPGMPAGDLLAAANVLRNNGHHELAERLEHKHVAEQAAIATATGAEA